MKNIIKCSILLIVSSFLWGMSVFAQVTISGYIREMTGLPIAGATVTLVNLNDSRKTDSEGYYDFSVTDIQHAVPYADYSLVSQGDRLFLNLEKRENVSVRLYDLSGKLIHTALNKSMQQGDHAVDLNISEKLGQQVYIAKIQIGASAITYKMTALEGNIIGMSEVRSFTQDRMQNATAILQQGDSIVVTHPNYFGGLDQINTRKVSSLSGTQNFRMFSSDTTGDAGWWASEMNFNFEPSGTGVSYYQDIMGDWARSEQLCQMEIQQCFYRTADEIPSSKKWDTYRVNCNANIGGVASTGGNTCNISPSYCNNKPWWEIEGVHHHEMCHSYQQYYNHSGVSGFGESIPDAVRCLTGFFYWPKGTTCRGGYNQAYQGGARYWIFIELKHPGFIYEIMSSGSSGDFASKVQDITGESLDDLCSECESDGMPYTLGRGRF